MTPWFLLIQWKGYGEVNQAPIEEIVCFGSSQGGGVYIYGMLCGLKECMLTEAVIANMNGGLEPPW